jgi:hypothetical protein
MVNLPTLQKIHRHLAARLKEYQDDLTELERLPAFPDRLVESHPLLSSGVCLPIDAISCSSTFLNAYEIKESNDSYLFLVNLQPLHPNAKCQPIACLSAATGNGSDIQGTFDQNMMKVKTHIRVSSLSSDSDPFCNCRRNDFFIWWLETYQENGRNLDELFIVCMMRN